MPRKQSINEDNRIITPALPPELIVITKDAAGVRASAFEVASRTGADLSPLKNILIGAKAKMTPLFGKQEDKLLHDMRARSRMQIAPELEQAANYYRVDCAPKEMQALAEELRKKDFVDAAYVVPGASLPFLPAAAVESGPPPPVLSADFSDRQGYLDPAPNGVDARFAWTIRGGSGRGIRIGDVEGGWNLSHEDLLENQGGLVAGLIYHNYGWVNHGTNVFGILSGDSNSRGIKGIAPGANVRAVSSYNPHGGISWAISQASNMLRAGDILLIEQHLPGPRFNYENTYDQSGFIPVEWWPHEFTAIKMATHAGIIVVEAAGNGNENLDDSLYDVNPGLFPPGWRNPLRRGGIDSGAILVGAGAAPEGTHGRGFLPARSRLPFSNYGSIIDAQGWGEEVTTSGGYGYNDYGDLQGGFAMDNYWYTDMFGGTSSASPIVVGAIACVQGILKSADQPLLTPLQVRELLRQTGSQQQDGQFGEAAEKPIGSLPNIRRMIETVLHDCSSLFVGSKV